jgi:hypothetical protein
MVIPTFLLLLFSVGDFGYSLPMDLTDNSEHTEKSLETRQAWGGAGDTVCKSTLLLDIIILLVNEFYLLVGLMILAGVAFGLYEVFDQVKHCTEEHKVEREFTQYVVQNISKTAPSWNVMMYHDEDSAVDFHNYTHRFTELALHCFGKTQGYDVYVFESGTFTLAGDGGYENWAFYGSFQQSGSQVTFYSMNPTIPASQYFLLNNDFRRHLN